MQDEQKTEKDWGTILGYRVSKGTIIYIFKTVYVVLVSPRMCLPSARQQQKISCNEHAIN